MNQLYSKTAQSITNNCEKLTKLNYLLQNHKINNLSKFASSNKSRDFSPEFSKELSKENFFIKKDSPFYLSLIENPINLLFSMDQFFFEFSKKTYQQKKTGEFFQQLKERKKLSMFYGNLNRKYLVNLFNIAKKHKGYFSKNLLCLLERRLDVVLYRSGITKTIAEARQLVLHKKILVNNNPVNFPAFVVNPGDIISITSKTSQKKLFFEKEGLNEKLVKSLNIKLKKNHPLIFGDFYSKFKKIIDLPNPTEKSKSPSLSHQNFHSKLLCNLFIQLVCSRIKLRSFYNLNRNRFYSEKNLTMLKWKSFSSRKSSFEKMKNAQQNRSQNGDILRGYLERKPLFCSQSFKKSQKKSFFKNQKKVLFDKSLIQRDKKNLKSLSFKKKNLLLYRNSFLVFLKYLDNYKKFRGLVHLNLKKILFKGSSSKHKSSLWKNLTFRIIKPMHLEVSYKLLNVIYLYSPQRLNFPFSIDLDLINRSLS